MLKPGDKIKITNWHPYYYREYPLNAGDIMTVTSVHDKHFSATHPCISSKPTGLIFYFINDRDMDWELVSEPNQNDLVDYLITTYNRNINRTDELAQERASMAKYILDYYLNSDVTYTRKTFYEVIRNV